MKKILLILALGSTLFGLQNCRKEPQNSTGRIVPEKKEVVPLEVAFLNAEELILEQEKYDAFFGGLAVQVIREEKLLAFLVPKISAGTYRLEVNVNGHKYGVDYIVKNQAGITDPNAYINSTKDKMDPYPGYLDTMSTLSRKYKLSDSIDYNIALLREQLSHFENLLSGATDEDKAKLAQFMQANKDYFKPVDDIKLYIDTFNRLRQADYADNQLADLERRLTASERALRAKVIIGAAVSLASGMNPLVAAASLYFIAKEVINLHEISMAIAAKVIALESENALIYQVQLNKELNLENKKLFPIRVTMPFRNPNYKDINSRSPAMKRLLITLDDFRTTWNKVNAMLPTKLAGAPLELNNVYETNTAEFPVDPKYLSISNVSLKDVTPQLINTGSQIQIAFSTNATEDQNFTFDLVYNNPELANFPTRYSVNLRVADTNDILKRLEANMVSVAGGTFTMGCTAEQDSSCIYNEKPAHTVTLSGFKIGKYEVTQEEWTEVMGSNPSYFSNCAKCPVEFVSWNDIQTFLQKLNTRTGGKYRLPTEAEWEYAARGGNKSAGFKYSGSNSLSSVAWYDDNSDNKTHEVGQKAANELGLYDMSGNVWEWCSDWYDEFYYSISPSSNPGGPVSGIDRVLRGGSWTDNAWSCRVSNRVNDSPVDRGLNGGFRLVSPGL